MTATGWNTWDVGHVNALVHLPSSLRLRLGLVEPGARAQRFTFTWRDGVARLGPHAGDGSYAAIELQHGEARLRCEYGAAGDTLAVRVTPLAGCARLLVAPDLDGAWSSGDDWQSQIRAVWRGDLLLAEAGGRRWAAHVRRPAPSGVDGFAFPLDSPLLLTVGPLLADRADPPLLDPGALLDARRDAYAASGLRSEGWLAEAAEPLTRVIAWNTIWEPIHRRVCTPVSRDWCRNPAGFGSYVLFDWDTFFCALMAALEHPWLAVANARAIAREVTPAGFVPNFGSARGASEDRSQPPVGAYCTLKIARGSAIGGQMAPACAELLAELYPALLRWHDWWLPHRDGNGDGLLEWGSDRLPPGAADWQSHSMQAAMYESGLDNSPMYDGVRFDEQAHTMQLADVGLNALYALDAWALAEIARELGRAEDAARLADEYAGLAERINRELWSEEAGSYLNRRWDGSFAPQRSPTLLYPLLAGIATPERAARIVRDHLLDERGFWGRYVIPSISRDDPAYADQEYWRGRIWGPMNFLVAEGLRRYRFDDVAHAFARRGLDLLLGEWRAEGHVHENYHAETGDGDDVGSSDPLYTWGALLAYVAMQELADAEPWGGWRFGSLTQEPGALRGVRLAEGELEVETSSAGLRVALGGVTLLTTDRPALVTGYVRQPGQLAFSLLSTLPPAETPCALALGGLPPDAALRVVVGGQEQTAAADSQGTLALRVSAPADVRIAWG